MPITKEQVLELDEYLDMCVENKDEKAILIKKDSTISKILASYLGLRNTLEIANHQYRNSKGGASTLSDQLFDSELKLLERIEANLPIAKEIGDKLFGKESITSRVG